jgi:hypothetical protein
MKTIAMWVAGCALGLTANACTLQTSEDSSRYSQAIPQTKDVALAVPGSTAGGSATQSTHAALGTESFGGLHTLGNPTPAGGYAQWYVFTRDVADSVDWGTGVILGAVWIIVHTKPTSVSSHQAEWGPGQGDALDPVSYRLTVDEIASEEYNYKLEGRPKASTSEADFKVILGGHGYGESRPEHKMGSFTLDQDAYNALDPLRAHDSGQVAVKFDGRQFPATIEADVKHTADAEWYNVTVTHNADGSGEVDIVAHGDVSEPRNGTLEDVTLKSRWNASGAGRADVKVTGGDISGMVLGSECWSTAFATTYYNDSANYKPTQGTASSCVFQQAQL